MPVQQPDNTTMIDNDVWVRGNKFISVLSGMTLFRTCLSILPVTRLTASNPSTGSSLMSAE